MSWWVRHLAARFGSVVALDDVSVEIVPGRLHAVVGGDGAGKSTLLKVIAGLDVGQSGDVRLPAPERIGYVPSAGGVFGDLTVDENLELIAAAFRLSRAWHERADDLLDRAGIGPFGDRLAARLSGGQRRKLAGCMALLAQPDLLVLDEVTTGVDPVSRLELWRLVTSAAAAGTAVVVATTYLDEAERMEQVVLLHRGHVLARGAPGEVVAGVPGAVRAVDEPRDRRRAWRSGRRWREWSPERHRDDPVMTFEDAAIVLELGADDSDDPTGDHGADRCRDGAGVGGPEVASSLVASHVTRRFGPFTAVEDVDLTVEPGEIVGLVGANGAGKTTLVKMLLGLLLPTAGSVRLFGRSADREQRRRIGYVPQDLGLYTDLTAQENLDFRAEIFGVVPANAPEGSALVREQPLGRQRITAFEAATQHGPDLLVLDEPTSGVSPLARSRLWDLIHEQADRGVAVLVSTHYLDEAEQADRVVVMSRGRVAAAGTTRAVVADRTTVEVVTERWADAFAALDRPGRRLRLAGRTVRVLGEDPDDVVAELSAAGLEVSARSVPATLEEVLIELDLEARRS